MEVEDEIVRHFCAQDGTWLVDRSVLNEARLLKRAVARIEWLKARLAEIETPTQRKRNAPK